jgi:hypothetical protein
MKLFKSIDMKFKDIGFIKISEDVYGARYEREIPKYKYIQCLDLLHKENGKHLIQSYQKGINKDGFNNDIGLGMYEAKLALKKMKQMGFTEIH